jgi:hypothetical protein
MVATMNGVFRHNLKKDSIVMDIKLDLNPGVELREPFAGIARAVVIDATRRFELSWDRFIRLHNTAVAVAKRVKEATAILDVGGFDGSLAMFLPEFPIDVIDPITTGGSGVSISSDPYEVVVSIDAVEHVPPDDRKSFLEQVSNASKHKCFINFPARHTLRAQRLIYELTDNPLVKEHVEWQLPDRDEVRELLEKNGFHVETIGYASLAQWVSQYMLQTVSPETAAKVSKYLFEEHLSEPVGVWLYDLLIGTRRH